MEAIKTIVNKVSVPSEKKTKQKEYLPKGTLPIIDQGQMLIGGYTNDTSKTIVCDLPVIVFGDHTCCVKYIDFPFGAGADGIKVIKPKEGALPKYLYYGIQYLLIRISNRGYGRHYQHIEKMFLNVPSISQQKQIVSQIEEQLSQLDSAVETLKKTKQQLEVYRQAVLKEAFSGNLTKKWRENNKDNSIETIIDSISSNKKKGCLIDDFELFELPNNWKWITIGDISKGAEYGTSKKSQKAGKTPVVRMGNLQNGSIDWSDLVYSDDDEEISKYCLHSGDVLFNRTNSPELVGKTAIYRGEREAIFAGYLIRINQIDYIDSDYLNYYLNSHTARMYGNKVKTDGVNQSNINGKKLCSYPFPLCSEKEQKQVVFELKARLSLCDNIEQTVNQSLQQAEALRQSILKQAFEGDSINV